MATFTVHTIVRDENFQSVSFAPGDDVPEWAANSVGAHCITPGGKVNAADGTGRGPAARSTSVATATGGPDFTGSTTKNRK